MAEQVENTRREEHRTRSDLVLEALRTYISIRQFPKEIPTPAEQRAIVALEPPTNVVTTSHSMNSADKKLWLVALAGPAQKSLKGIPSNDRARIRLAIDEMEGNPFRGDVRKLKGGREGFRRRVGD